MTEEEKLELIIKELFPSEIINVDYNPLKNHDEAFDIVRLLGKKFDININTHKGEISALFWNEYSRGRGSSKNKLEAICIAALNAIGINVLNNKSREPKIIYVYAILDNKDNQGETRVVISEKSYWKDNGSCQDYHLEEDIWIEPLLEKLELEEEMESEFSTELSKEDVILAFKEHPSFEYDEKFQKFIEDNQ